MVSFPERTLKERVTSYLEGDSVYHIDYQEHIISQGIQRQIPIKVIVAYIEVQYQRLQHLNGTEFTKRVARDLDELKTINKD